MYNVCEKIELNFEEILLIIRRLHKVSRNHFFDIDLKKRSRITITT